MSMHPTRNYFAEFKGENTVFIETGSYRGDGIQLALEAGYEHIFTIDNDAENVHFCIDRFKGIDNIHFGTGESPDCLCVVFEMIKGERATLWLDAHWQMLEGTEPGKNPFPLLDELAIIYNYGGRRDHTILIDDMLIMQDDIVRYNAGNVRNWLFAINEHYEIKKLANPVINGILLAHIPNV